jgi:hypothetical protein
METVYRETREDKLEVESCENAKCFSPDEDSMMAAEALLEDQVDDRIDNLYSRTNRLGQEINNMAASAHADGLNIEQSYDLACKTASMQLGGLTIGLSEPGSIIDREDEQPEQPIQVAEKQLCSVLEYRNKCSNRTLFHEYSLDSSIKQVKNARKDLLYHTKAPTPKEISKALDSQNSD